MSVSFGDGPFVEGETYVGDDGVSYCYQDGCFIIAAPEDVDTVDGYSVPGVAPDGAVDSITGDAIEPGAPVTVFYGPDGTVTGYKDCTDADTFGVLTFATMTGVDDAGNDYVAGDPVLLLPNGERLCVSKTVDTDTFAGLIVAGADGTDDAGNAYAAGDALIQLAGGELVCASKTIDTDTVDGFSVQGVSDGSQLDLDGNAIPADAPIITFYDADGNVINSKDCTDSDTFAILQTATEDGSDTAGNAYVTGDPILELPNGDIVCVSKTIDTDTFSELIVAGAAGADSAGNDYAVGDTLIQLADGSLICTEKTIDTVDGFALQGTSDGTALDADGNAIAAGAPIVTFYDSTGTPINSKDCTDEFATLIDAPGAGIDDAGNAYAQGDQLILLPGGELICAEKTIDTDTVDGFALQGVSDGTQLDAAGNPIPADAPIITFYDATGVAINSKDCTDADTFAILRTAVADGTDTAGNAYATGDPILELPNGDIVCVSKTVDTDTDTFAELIVAGEAGVDDAGNEYGIGDTLIQLADGSLICAEKPERGGVQTPDGTTLTVDALSGNQVATQCCSWDLTVDAQGNVTNPFTQEVTATGFAEGTLVDLKTDENGSNASVHCIVEDPIVDTRCVRGSVQDTTAKGSVNCHNARFANASSGTASTALVDASTPLGPIAASEICMTLPAVKCGQRINVTTHTGYTPITDPGETFNNMIVQLTDQFSADGGATWANMQVTGGVDQIHVGLNTGIGAQSEHSFTAAGFGVLHVDEAVEYCTRISVERNQIAELSAASRIIVNTSNAMLTTIREQCC